MEKKKLKPLKPGDMVKIISGLDMGCFAIILRDENKLVDVERIYIFNTKEYTWYYRSSLKKVG